MQTQWAKANIRSETKDTPLGSQGGQLFPLSEGSDLNWGGLFKPISKLGAAPSCCARSVSIKALRVCQFIEEGFKAQDSSHNTTQHAIMTMLSLSQPGYLLMGSRG